MWGFKKKPEKVRREVSLEVDTLGVEVSIHLTTEPKPILKIFSGTAYFDHQRVVDNVEEGVVKFHGKDKLKQFMLDWKRDGTTIIHNKIYRFKYFDHAEIVSNAFGSVELVAWEFVDES